MAFLDGLQKFFGKLWPSGKISALYYFDEVLPHEFAAINARRRRLEEKGQSAARRGDVAPSPAASTKEPQPRTAGRYGEGPARETGVLASRVRYPDPAKVFRDAEAIGRAGIEGSGPSGDGILRRTSAGGSGGGGDGPPAEDTRARADEPKRDRMRPLPVPCDATGLALSGGGIRSAAVCLGALQALHLRGRLAAVDYLSTVSGGGYIGACLSAAMSDRGGRAFPFGADVFDSPAIARLRNNSNYLMPRNRSGVRNWFEAIALVLRGLLANTVVVLAILLPCVVVTALTYPTRVHLDNGSMTLVLLDAALRRINVDLVHTLGPGRFMATLAVAAMLAVVLLIWAMLRTITSLDRVVGDTCGWPLRIAHVLLVLILVAAFLDFQPVAIEAVLDLRDYLGRESNARLREALTTAWGSLAAFAGGVAAFAGGIGRFLETSNRASGFRTLLKRGLAKAALLVAALIVPLALWWVYLYLSGLAIGPEGALSGRPIPAIWPIGEAAPMVRACLIAALAAIVVAALLTPNGYSLHRFYRDRLSAAFIFQPPATGSTAPTLLDDLKLSDSAAATPPITSSMRR